MTRGNSGTPLDVTVTVDWWVVSDTGRMSTQKTGSLLQHALEHEDRRGSWDFAIRFVDDPEMTRLHDMYLSDPTPTDIMTFPYDREVGMVGGDIVISVDTAARNASDAGWELAEELDFLMLHGLLHVLGWDDHGDTHRTAMLERQHELLMSWKQAIGDVDQRA